MSPRQNTSGPGPWRKILLLLLILPLLLLGGALALLIESQPLVAPLAAPSISDALRARALAKRLLQGLESQQEIVEFHASAGEINGMLSLAGRGLPAFSGLVELSPQAVRIKTSLKLPPTALQSYLNLQMDLLPSQNGVTLGHIRLGRIVCSSRLGLRMIRLALDLGLGRGEGSAILDSVQRLAISNQQLQIQLRDPSKLKTRLNRLPTRLARLRDLTFPLASPWPLATVQIYSERLQEVTDQLPTNAAPPLGHYLQGLFQLAQQRSVEGDPTVENQAALLALAGGLGDRRFSRLVSSGAAKAAAAPPPAVRVKLAGRNDLRRHFVISAGLQLLVDQGLTAAIGELKELLDAGRRSSGFSFSDLAADRAGSALARSASDPKKARQLQRLLAASADEANFFPSLEGLPDNLSQQQFESRFGNLDSPAYLQLLQEIDRRLEQLPIHR